MSTIDDIARERQRLQDQLARLDQERARLTGELGELEAAERVLVRLTGEQRLQLPLLTPRRRRRVQRAEEGVGAPSLGEATLRAVEALGEGATAGDVRAYLAQEFGMHVRPNHLGMALQRHRRAGRLEQHDGRWSVRYALART